MIGHDPYTVGEIRLPVGPETSMPDGQRRWLDGLDVASRDCYADPGPSPGGNAGPYLKVPHGVGEDRTVHRLYCRWARGCVVRIGGLRFRVAGVDLTRFSEGWMWSLSIDRSP